MKVFIGGPKRLDVLDGAVKAKLKELARAGAEMLISDCSGTDTLVLQELIGYKAVTVYVSGGHARSNEGNWPVVSIPAKRRHGKFRSAYRHQKNIAMAEAADCGFMIWNGTCKKTFFDIADLLYRKKPVDVYLSRRERLVTLTCLEDLRRLVIDGNHAADYHGFELSWKEKREFLDTFMPSAEMREFLARRELSRHELSDIVCGAPVKLQTKAEWMKRLSNKENLFLDILDEAVGEKDGVGIDFIIWNMDYYSLAGRHSDMQEALNELRLKRGELFYLTDFWYDEELHEDKGSGKAPFLSLEKALECIRGDIADYCEYAEPEADDSFTCWYELEKWTPDGHGNLRNTYSYFLLKDEIVYFEINTDINGLEDRDDLTYFMDGSHLNLPVPFCAGDIVTIDCTPFAPKKHAVLLEVGDNRDCCCVQALYRNYDGTWYTGAVKHAQLFKLYTPMMSPLYRLQSCTGELSEEEALLGKVSRCIAGDENRGRALWNALYELRDSKDGGLSEADIAELLDE